MRANFFFVLSLAVFTSEFSWGSCNSAKDISRIAVAGGSITEILYLLGEEKRIIAADRTSNYPKEALELPSVGYVRNISAEGILSLKPTLVLGEHDMGPDEVIKQIENVSVEVIRVNEVHTASGIVDKLRCVASILGVNDKADSLIENRIGNLINQLDVVRSRSEFRSRVALVLNFSKGIRLCPSYKSFLILPYRMRCIQNEFFCSGSFQ